jgi:GGDEF domain-containing protein
MLDVNTKKEDIEERVRLSKLFHMANITGLLSQNVPLETVLQLLDSAYSLTDSYDRALAYAYDRGFSDGDTDPQMGMPRRNMLAKDLDEHRTGSGKVYALVFDAEGLREVNNCLSSGDGDRLLESFAKLIKSVFKRKTDRIYRLGGDEVVAFLFNCDDKYVSETIPDLVKDAHAKMSMFQTIGDNEMPSVLLPFNFRYTTIEISPELTKEQVVAKLDPKNHQSRRDFVHLEGTYANLNPSPAA